MALGLPEPGQLFAGRYRVEETLGRGGMAVVYRARDLQHGRDVALKVLLPQVGVLLGTERFLREVTTTARLTHPNILPLFDSGSEQGLSWYVMPYLPGRTLKDRLAEGPLPLAEALRLFADIASGLEHAHREGVIHRDLKPANILLQQDRAAIADFGIALPLGQDVERLTETGFAVGTPEYMSPEQALAERAVDGRSDQYALGCVLYEMLAGEPPFTGSTAKAVLAKRLREPTPRVSTLREVPPGLEAAIGRALAREPADRFPSVAAFAEAVAQAAEARPAPVDVARTRAMGRRGQWVAAGVLLAGLAVAIALVARPRPGHTLNPRLVAVLPFRVNAPGADLSGWQEGMVDLLAAKLTGEGGPRAADPRATLAAYNALTRASPAELGERLATQLGAGQVLDGSIEGDAHHVLISATLSTMPGNRRGSPVSVEGPPDSILTLIDRLVIVLLGREAGVGTPALATVTTLPAWQAYLEGREAFREGRADDAIRAYHQALEIDSSFYLAARELLPALWRQGDDDSVARQLLVKGLPRMSSSDSLLFYALMGPNYPRSATVRDRLRIKALVASRFPERSDAWFELGDEQLHHGPLVDLDSSTLQARRSFGRAFALDSSADIVAAHLLFIAFEEGDTATIRRLSRLDVLDSLGVATPFLRWRAARALGDTAMLRQVQPHFASLPEVSMDLFMEFSQGDGVGIAEAIQTDRARRDRAVTPAERARAADYHTVLALNLGHPADARRQGEPGLVIADAVFGEGDTLPAAAAARAIRGSARRTPVAGYEGWLDLFLAGCWDLSRGRLDAVGSLPAELRSPLLPRGNWPRDYADDSLIGPRLLEAWMAVAQRRPEALPMLERLDTLAATGPATGLGRMLPLALGRLFERLGDHERAWRALQRVPWTMIADQPLSYNYHAVLFLARARAGGAAGHRAEAIHDYRVYLAMRGNPDPALVPERDSARAELALLVGPPARGTGVQQ